MSLLAIEEYVNMPLSIACTVAGILGAIIGSFLNVVIHRVPREQSIVFPNSACPSCHTALRPYDNIPILSFLILRGRCRFCRKSISIRYPIVEALLALIFIDAEHMILPNVITYPGILFAIMTRIALPYLVGPAQFDDLQG